jgi:hypothetical protein
MSQLEKNLHLKFYGIRMCSNQDEENDGTKIKFEDALNY